jgi:hypothetical protein
MVKKKKVKESVTTRAANLFYFLIPTKRNKTKKKIIDENKNASKNKPELVKLLDEKEARKLKLSPDGIYNAIADMIVESLIDDIKKKDRKSVENIQNILADAEDNFSKKEGAEIHKNRMYIKERLRQETYNGIILLDSKDNDEEEPKQPNKKSKKNSEISNDIDAG